MKRTVLAVLVAVATLVVTTAFAAKPVPAPQLPENLDIIWKKTADDSCTRGDGVVVSLKVYEKQEVYAFPRSTINRQFYLMTKNGEVVHQLQIVEDAGIISPDAYVKMTDGTWTHYDWTTEKAEAYKSIRSIVGMTGREFINCVLGK